MSSKEFRVELINTLAPVKRINKHNHLPIQEKGARKHCVGCAKQGQETRTSISCPECNVALCLDCYRSWHHQ
ncbi:hypothetical protein QOT17_005999 [Balamuthia mandrillaris]